MHAASNSPVPFRQALAPQVPIIVPIPNGTFEGSTLAVRVPTMARKKIREYDSKRLLKAHIQRLSGITLPLNVAQVAQSLSRLKAKLPVSLIGL